MTRVTTFALGGWLVLMLAASPAAAQTKAECIAAHEATQALTQASKLLDAREKATLCSAEACPGALQRECVEMLASVQAAIPSVALRMRDGDGNDLTDVRVRLDGAVLKESLDGKPFDVDPGSHTFRFEPKEGEAIERLVVVVPGQRNLLIEVQLEKKAPPLPPPVVPRPDPVVVPQPDPKAQTDIGYNYLAIAGWSFAAVSFASFASFAGVGAAGMSERSDLDVCKPRCTDDVVDPVRTKLVVADVFLAIGAVSAATAVVLLPLAYTDHTPEQPATALVIGPGSLTIRGAF